MAFRSYFLLAAILLVPFWQIASAQEPAPAGLPPEYEAQIKAAIEKADKALEKNPDDIDALLSRAAARGALGQLKEYESDINEAVKRFPKNGQVWHAVALFKSQLRRPTEALHAYDKAIELGLEEGYAYMNRGDVHMQLGDSEKAHKDFTEAIKRGLPAGYESWVYQCRGSLWDLETDFEKAIADFDKAIELDPQWRDNYVARSICYIFDRQHQRFLDDQLRALERSPDDLGSKYELEPDVELTPEDLEHGEEQLRRMLADRPAMGEHMESGDKLWTWAVRRFAGSGGMRIDWDPKPAIPLGGQSGQPQRGNNATIQVSPTDFFTQKPYDFDKLWAIAVFELHNTVRFAGTEVTDPLGARTGEISEEEYIQGIFHFEDLTMQETRAFYLKFYLPWMLAKKLSAETGPLHWSCSGSDWETHPDDRLEHWRSDPRWQIYSCYYKGIRAKWALEIGEPELAAKVLDRMLKDLRFIPPDLLPELLWSRMSAFHQSGKVEEGVEFFSQLMEQTKDQPNIQAELFHSRANLHIVADRLTEAFADIEQAIKVAPKTFYLFVSRAKLHARTGDVDSAMKDFDRAFEVDPNNSWIDNQKVDVLSSEGHWQEAVEAADRWIEREPKMVEAYGNRAKLLLNVGEVERACEDYTKILELDSTRVPVYLGRGQLYFFKKKYKEALNDFSACVRLAPENPGGYYWRARLSIADRESEVHNPELALADAKKACELTDWKSHYYLLALANAYDEMGENKSAIKWAKEALRRCDPNEDAYSILQAIEHFMEKLKE